MIFFLNNTATTMIYTYCLTLSLHAALPIFADGKVSAVHDCADGGLLVAVTEMALAGNIGAILEPDAGIALHAWAFGEDQARYVVTSANGADIAEAARAAGVPVAVIGRSGGDSIALEVARTVSHARKVVVV